MELSRELRKQSIPKDLSQDWNLTQNPGRDTGKPTFPKMSGLKVYTRGKQVFQLTRR